MGRAVDCGRLVVVVVVVVPLVVVAVAIVVVIVVAVVGHTMSSLCHILLTLS